MLVLASIFLLLTFSFFIYFLGKCKWLYCHFCHAFSLHRLFIPFIFFFLENSSASFPDRMSYEATKPVPLLYFCV